MRADYTGIFYGLSLSIQE